MTRYSHLHYPHTAQRPTPSTTCSLPNSHKHPTCCSSIHIDQVIQHALPLGRYHCIRADTHTQDSLHRKHKPPKQNPPVPSRCVQTLTAAALVAYDCVLDNHAHTAVQHNSNHSEVTGAQTHELDLCLECEHVAWCSVLGNSLHSLQPCSKLGRKTCRYC
jgi:hypothetical protein